MSDHAHPGGTPGEPPARPGETRTPDGVQYDSDVNVKGVVTTTVWLAVGTLVSMLLMYWLFLGLRSYNQAQDPPPPALREVRDRRLPPLPRLQSDPDREMLELRAAEDRLLLRPAWIDERQGTLRLPIDIAIDVVARQGVPGGTLAALATSPAAAPSPAPPAPPTPPGPRPARPPGGRP